MKESLEQIRKTAQEWCDKNRLKKAIEIWNTALESYPEKKADIYYEIANLERQLGHYKESLIALNNHLTCLQETPNTPTISIALAHFYIAGSFDSLWRLDAAIMHYQEAYTIAKNTLAADDPSLISLEKQLNAAKEKLTKHPKNQKE